MPTLEEKFAQVETALRHRFLPHVPKVETPNRSSWLESDHDKNRLSRCLAAYAIVSLAHVDDATALASLTDGEDDGGIDAFYFDKNLKRLWVIQAKFKKNTISQDENNKSLTGLRHLLNRNFDIFNEATRNRSDIIEEALDTPGTVVELVLVFLSDHLSEHVKNDMVAAPIDFARLVSSFSWNWVGCSKVCTWLESEQHPTKVESAVITLENWVEVNTPHYAIYGQVGVSELAELVHSHGSALFERNIRHYLGAKEVNIAIGRSLRAEAGDFFYLNNGLTAIAEKIIPAAGNTSRRFELKNVSIVNGAQTAGSIAHVATRGELPSDAKVMITIIQVDAQSGDLAERITRARNKQNTLSGIEFAALDNQQERLRRELAAFGVTYYYRPSIESTTRNDDTFTLQEAAIAVACLKLRLRNSSELQSISNVRFDTDNAIPIVVAAKSEVGRLWNREDIVYKRLFNQELTGLNLCRMVRIYRLLDQILRDYAAAETLTRRKTFFRHGNYFIMAAIAHVLPEIIQRSDVQLTTEDKTALSRRANEVSELIYVISESPPNGKGYLATFRNLTDTQVITDALLNRLHETQTSLDSRDTSELKS